MPYRIKVIQKLLLVVIFGLFLAIGMVSSTSLAFESMDLPIQLQFKLLIKAATYDRSQQARDSSILRVGIVHTSHENSLQVAQDVYTLFGDAKLPVRQYMLEVVPIEFHNREQLKKDTNKNQIHVYYIAPGNTPNLPSILETSRQFQILTMTGISDYVHQGVTLGVASNGSRPQFLYNQTTAHTSGVDFHANFLRLVRVIKD